MASRETAAVAVAAFSLGVYAVAAGHKATLTLLVCYLLALTTVFFGARRRKGRRGNRLVECKGFSMKAMSRQTSQDGDSFLFDEAVSRSLFVSAESMASFEEVVGRVYAGFGSKAMPVPMRAHLERLHEMLGLPRQEKGLSEPVDDIMLARTLVARDFDVEKTAACLKQYIRWRRELNGGVVPSARSLDRDLISVPFEDRLGRPVVVVKVKNLDPRMAPKSFLRFYRAILDVVVAHCLHKRKKKICPTNPMEQYLLLIDMEGAGWNNFSVQLLQMMTGESNSNYPDRLSQVYVLGCNATVLAIWQVAQPIMHERTRRKVQLVSAADVKKIMCELVDLELLPPRLGGTALARSSAAQTFADKAGHVAAAVWRRYGITPTMEACGRASVARRESRGFLEKYDISIDGVTEESGAVARSRAECSELVVRVEALLGLGPARSSEPDAALPKYGYGCIGSCEVFSCFGMAQVKCDVRTEARTAEDLEAWLNKMLGVGGEATEAVLNFVSSSSARLPPPPLVF